MTNLFSLTLWTSSNSVSKYLLRSNCCWSSYLDVLQRRKIVFIFLLVLILLFLTFLFFLLFWLLNNPYCLLSSIWLCSLNQINRILHLWTWSSLFFLLISMFTILYLLTQIIYFLPKPIQLTLLLSQVFLCISCFLQP